MGKQIRINSTAPSKRPVTLSGWYECTDGSWAKFRAGGEIQLGPVPHYDRPPTRDEEQADMDAALAHR